MGTPQMNATISTRRKGLRLSERELVTLGSLDGLEGFPLVVTPAIGDLNLAAWAAGNRQLINMTLISHGAILFRGFSSDTVDHFSRFVHTVTTDVLDYQERAAARTQVAAQIFTSTEFPRDLPIPLHHEMSFSHCWPGKILFHCRQPAQSGGQTPIADDRRVVEQLPKSIKDLFLEKGVMYVKNYGEGLDLSWQEAFQTDDRHVVERYCNDARMQFEWRSGGRLRTRAIRHVMVPHPTLGTRVWFNHAHMFHLSSLAAPIRDGLLSQFAEDEVPRNAFFADGSAIPDALMEDVRCIYRENMVAFDWQFGDILLVDNFLVSHGREPFEGARQILVAMAERYSLADDGSSQPQFEPRP
jgi:alpha-ketoglutarate-dependent taurine dioxygenase